MHAYGLLSRLWTLSLQWLAICGASDVLVMSPYRRDRYTIDALQRFAVAINSNPTLFV